MDMGAFLLIVSFSKKSKSVGYFTAGFSGFYGVGSLKEIPFFLGFSGKMVTSESVFAIVITGTCAIKSSE
jgi:hypothetical protein